MPPHAHAAHLLAGWPPPAPAHVGALASASDPNLGLVLLISLLLLLCVVCAAGWVIFWQLAASVARRQQQLLQREAACEERAASEARAHKARSKSADHIKLALGIGASRTS